VAKVGRFLKRFQGFRELCPFKNNSHILLELIATITPAITTRPAPSGNPQRLGRGVDFIYAYGLGAGRGSRRGTVVTGRNSGGSMYSKRAMTLPAPLFSTVTRKTSMLGVGPL